MLTWLKNLFIKPFRKKPSPIIDCWMKVDGKAQLVKVYVTRPAGLGLMGSFVGSRGKSMVVIHQWDAANPVAFAELWNYMRGSVKYRFGDGTPYNM